MGNVITFDYKSKKDDDDIVMSNGMTDVLLDYLLLRCLGRQIIYDQ